MADVTDKLKDLAELLREGLITREQFDQQRDALLSSATKIPESTPAPGSANPLSGATRIASSSLPTQLGSYRILETIGEGGMGKVVRGRHVDESWAERQGGDVAIKLVHPHLASNPEYRERFLDEADLGRRLQHESLARVQEVLITDSWLGAVMDFVEGETLSAAIVTGGLPLASVIEYLRPIAEALDYLHHQGIIHRDLKPDNIKTRPDGRTVILDLGIAKDVAADHGRTRTAVTLGTTAWMAPEQVDAKHVTAAADRYALGLLAYALLSGQMPWEPGQSEYGISSLKCEGRLIPLRERLPELATSVEQAVMTMLSREPSARYGSGTDFLAALQQLPVQKTRPASVTASMPAPAPESIQPSQPASLQTARVLTQFSSLRTPTRRGLNAGWPIEWSVEGITSLDGSLRPWFKLSTGRKSALKFLCWWPSFVPVLGLYVLIGVKNWPEIRRFLRKHKLL